MQDNVASRFNLVLDVDKTMPANWTAALDEQLRIVEHASIQPNILKEFKTVPILFVPRSDFDARYRVNSGVEVGINVMPLNRPIILHELIHFFHCSIVENGFANAAIIEYYERALRFELYPKKSYMMKNVQEFVAMTATVLVYGEIKRPPFTRHNLKSKQPNFYHWLVEALQSPVSELQSAKKHPT